MTSNRRSADDGHQGLRADTTDRTRTMGRGTTDAEGVFSLSVGLGIVMSDTTAALDGQADVTGNVNVTANQVKLPVPSNNLKRCG